jgi:hypothetical protein
MDQFGLVDGLYDGLFARESRKFIAAVARFVSKI